MCTEAALSLHLQGGMTQRWESEDLKNLTDAAHIYTVPKKKIKNWITFLRICTSPEFITVSVTPQILYDVQAVRLARYVDSAMLS
jgi:hypothetical protein